MQHLTENLQKFISDRQGVVLLGALSRADASLRSSDRVFCIDLLLYEISSFFGKNTFIGGVFFLPAKI